jgi:hypothetical protein
VVAPSVEPEKAITAEDDETSILEDEEQVADVKAIPEAAQPIEEEALNFRDILKINRVRLLWVMLFLSACKSCLMFMIPLVYGMIMASIFKVFGQEKGIDDYTLTLAGSLGALANGISRFTWPIL